jgi:hypothetical protein
MASVWPPGASTAASDAAGENWTLTHDIAILSKSPSGRVFKDETVTADLYRPNVEGRVPSAVIINSSGGVSPLWHSSQPR